MIQSFSLAVILLLPGLAISALADSNHSNCDLPDVKTIPVELRAHEAQTFSYRFRFIESAKDHAPVVIFIPGGPGDNSITAEDPRVSDTYSLILTDPRGEGCNQTETIQSSDISTERIADDIIAVIQSLDRKVPYIIHGFSAGTTVATIVSAKIAEQKIRPPEAIFLEGVVGRHYSVKQDGFGVSRSWANILSKLDSKTRDSILQNQENPFGVKQGNFEAAIRFMTFIGAVHWMNLSYDGMLKVMLESFAVGKAPSQDIMQLMMIGTYSGASHSTGKVYKSIQCTELSDETQRWLTYDHGVIGSRDPAVCTVPMTTPYDSKNWQMRDKTIYFIGEDDPNVAPHLAFYEFDHQHHSNKLAVLVRDGGHMSLQINLRDCMGGIIDHASESLASLRNEIAKCSAQTQIK